MFRKRLKELLLAVALLPIFVQPALAHVVWFDQEGEEYKLLYGHPEEGPQAYDPSRLKEATGFDKLKNVVPITIEMQEDGLSVFSNSEIGALTAFYDNGLYAITPSGWIRVSESEAGNYDEIVNPLKYAKSLYDWNGSISQPFGLPLEIMPLVNPFGVKTGESLPVQVWFKGNQIKDVLVEYEGKPLTLDGNGTAYVPIGEGGLKVIEASYEVLLNNSLIDTISYETSFTAESTSVPEPSAVLGLSVLGVMALAAKQGKKLKLTKSGNP